MARERTEIKLLAIRQRLRDALLVLEGQTVVPIKEYRLVMLKYLVAEELLGEYRQETWGRRVKRTR